MTSTKPGTRLNAEPQRNTRPPAGLLDSAEVAILLGTPLRFVRRLVAERRIPFHRVGKYVRFHPRDVENYLADNRVETGYAPLPTAPRRTAADYRSPRSRRPA